MLNKNLVRNIVVFAIIVIGQNGIPQDAPPVDVAAPEPAVLVPADGQPVPAPSIPAPAGLPSPPERGVPAANTPVTTPSPQPDPPVQPTAPVPPAQPNTPVSTAQPSSPAQSGLSAPVLPASKPEMTPPSALVAQPNTETQSNSPPTTNSGVANSEPQLRFRFEGTPWREVLQWLADEAKLSLQVAQLPPGSFTFSDPQQTYTPNEALDTINRTLLDKGYVLVKRKGMLFLFDLESEVARKLVAELAELVTAEALDERSDSDIVKSFLPLGSLTPEAAQEEIAKLIGPAGTIAVLPSARQVLITETASKLRTIRDYLKAADQGGPSGSVVDIPLKHRAAEEVLAIARPLLGIVEGDPNQTLRIATDLFGTRIYAMGEPAKLRQLEQIATKVDQPMEALSSSDAVPVEKPGLQTYSPGTADPTTVMDVLQTLLAGLPEVRLAIDPRNNNIVAMARPSEHEMIRRTLDELNGRGEAFEVVQLRRLDPQLAVLTINKFFGRSETNPTQGPTVDGDPATGRLWVKGTADQVRQVRELIEKLEGSSGAQSLLGDRLRMVPLTGTGAQTVLQQMEQYWELTGRQNRLRIVTPAKQSSGLPERRRREEPEAQPPAANPAPEVPVPKANEPAPTPQQDLTRQPIQHESAVHFVVQQDAPVTADQSPPTNPNAPTAVGNPLQDVVITVTPQGLILSSDDPEALDAAEELIRALSENTVSSNEPTIYWLRHAPAGATADLLTSILSGESGSGSGGSVLGDMAGQVVSELGGGILGGLLGGGSSGGGVLTASGSVSIIPDARLNALIVQASPQDLNFIDQLLEVIDRPDSPESIQITNTAEVIPVIYQDATQMAELVKSVYGDRVQSSGGSGGGRQPNPQEIIQALTGGRGGGGRGGGGGQPAQDPPKMSIGVDKQSNSLVVSAPPHLVLEVKKLVETLDQVGETAEEIMDVVPLGGSVNPEIIQKSLAAILGKPQPPTSTSSTSPSSSDSNRGSSSGGSSGGSEEEARQRFAEALRQRFGGGGGPPGGGGPGGGGTPGSSGFGGFRGFGGGTPGGAPSGGAPSGRGGERGGSTRGGR